MLAFWTFRGKTVSQKREGAKYWPNVQMFHAWGWCSFSCGLGEVRRKRSRQLSETNAAHSSTHNLWLHDVQLCKNAPRASSPVTNSHLYSAPPLIRFPKLFRTQLPARVPPPFPSPDPPPGLAFPAQPQTEERETTFHDHHHHCCRIAIQFGVDSWFRLSITHPNLPPYLSEMKRVSWNGIFTAREH